MQIEKISGYNIASLASRFEVDLTSDAIRGAGLFAITGKTGSGKSSILDAMCLALYGDCPRLSAESVNDEISDNEDRIRSSDPRSILRRGAPDAEACVEFMAQDGQSYRVVWKVRRARGSNNGRLQNVDRALYRVSDGSLICNQITAVKDAVINLTGLTYEEFRRTVLLAQGDFDAFLKAKTSDRAALLEKVTGTEIYRDISKRVYEEAYRSKAKLSEFEIRLSEHVSLSSEYRDNLEKELSTLTVNLSSHADKRVALDVDIQKHESLERARLLHNEAESKALESQNICEGSEYLRQDLKKLDAVLLIKPDVLQMKDAQKHVSACHESLNSSKRKLQVSKDQFDKAEESYTKAEAAYSNIEGLCTLFSEDWNRAAELDSQIITAKEELRSSEARVLEQKTILDAHQRQFREKYQDVIAGHAKLSDINDKLEKLKGFHPLTNKKDGFIASLKERVRLGDEIHDQNEKLDKHKKEFHSINEQWLILTRESEVASREIETFRRKSDAARESLKTFEAHPLSDQMVKITSAIATIRNLTSLTKEYLSKEARNRDLMSQLEETHKVLREAKEALHVAVPSYQSLSDEIDRLRAPMSLVEAAAGEAASRLRQSLIKGEPCPVCASTHHPVEDDAKLAAAARALRAELDLKIEKRDALQQDIRTHERKIDASESRILSFSEDIKIISSSIALIDQQYENHRVELEQCGLDLDAPKICASAESHLFELEAELLALKGETEKNIESERKIKKDIQDFEKRCDLLLRDQEKRRTDMSGYSVAISKTETSIEFITQWLKESKVRYDHLGEELRDPLLKIGCSLASLDKQKTDRIDKISYAFGLLGRLQSTADEVKSKLDEAKREYDNIYIKKDVATIALDDLVISASKRRAAVDALTALRSELLDGEATDKHKTRHNKMRLDAQLSVKNATDNLSLAKNDYIGWQSRCDEISKALDVAENAYKTKKDSLTALCEMHGVSLLEVEELLPESADAHAKITGQLKKIETDLLKAKEARDQRKFDLDSLISSGVPEIAKDELQRELEGLKEQDNIMISRRAEIKEKLATDDATRAEIKALQEMTRKARHEYETWQAVNGAIGSRGGDKFAKIAQSVTLSILVERANRHLKDIAPRYRLSVGGQDLSLRVVDQDMADDERSTRSLSGGERFLVSLSLALALSGMGRQGVLAGTLFIDEGFGSLDATSLDAAIDALEALQSQGRLVGVISHVDELKQRVPVQIKVQRRGGGSSVLIHP